jgi:hypothetical protein
MSTPLLSSPLAAGPSPTCHSIDPPPSPTQPPHTLVFSSQSLLLPPLAMLHSASFACMPSAFLVSLALLCWLHFCIIIVNTQGQLLTCIFTPGHPPICAVCMPVCLCMTHVGRCARGWGPVARPLLQDGFIGQLDLWARATYGFLIVPAGCQGRVYVYANTCAPCLPSRVLGVHREGVCDCKELPELTHSQVMLEPIRHPPV